MNTLVNVKIYEVKNRLENLFGMEVERFTTPLMVGWTAASFCTPDDAPTAPGFYRWNSTQRRLREELAPYSWVRNNDNNYCRVFSPCGKYAIAVLSGCVDTGNPSEYASPSNKCKKWTCTVDAIGINNQLGIPGLPQKEPEKSVKPDRETWVLLSHVDRVKNEIRAEISLPSDIEDGYITSWAERIILPVQALDSTPPVSPEYKPDFGPDIDIEIFKRSA